MREPFISLMSGTTDLIAGWGPLLIALTITDEKGTESDKLIVELDDRDGQCVYPGTGQVVFASGGYLGEGGRVQGEFEIDQIDLEGWPQKITLHGTPVSAKKATKERKTEAHKKDDTKTVGDLMGKIAKRNGWTPKVAPEIAKIPLEYEGQAGEFDTQFARRIAARYGGIFAVKQGKMVVTKAGSGMTASGQSLPPMVIAPGVNLISYRASYKKRVEHGKAQAHYFDRKDVKRVDVDAGQGEITYRLREAFKSKDEAMKAAEAKLSDLDRGEGSATFEIEGDTSAAAERPVSASGIRSKVDGAWSTIRAEHRFQDGTYVVTLECETPGKKADDADSKDDEK